MSIPGWWPDDGSVVESSGTHSGGCLEGAGGSPFSWRELWASLELPGIVGHPAMPEQTWNGDKSYLVYPTEMTSFSPPKPHITNRILKYYLRVSVCEL